MTMTMMMMTMKMEDLARPDTTQTVIWLSQTHPTLNKYGLPKIHHMIAIKDDEDDEGDEEEEEEEEQEQEQEQEQQLTDDADSADHDDCYDFCFH